MDVEFDSLDIAALLLGDDDLSCVNVVYKDFIESGRYE